MTKTRETHGFLAIACVFFAVLASIAMVSPAFATDSSRYAGEKAVDTAIETSKAAFADGSCDVVLLTRDDEFMDSMSATGLAGAYNAPILLNNSKYLQSQVLQEIQRLGAKKVIIIGGEVAMSPEVESALSNYVSVERVYGDRGYDTSVECAKAIEAITGDTSKIVVAASNSFMDALSMSSFAYKYKVPILIQSYGPNASDRFCTNSELALLKGDYANAQIFVAGGPDAVSYASVENALNRSVERIWGANGYETSNAVARYMTENDYLGTDTIGLANGQAENMGLDALTSSSLCAKNNAPILLTNNDTNSSTINGYVAEQAGTTKNILVFGGTEVISPVVEASAVKISNEQLRYVAIIGSDGWQLSDGSKHVEGSDLQMVMRIDTEDKSISLISIPRDTYYDCSKGGTVGHNTAICKCWHDSYKSNYAFHYGFYNVYNGSNYEEALRAGADSCVDMMESMINKTISDYAIVDLNTFVSIVDSFGGITVEVPLPINDYYFYSGEPSVSINYGTQVLSGWNSMVLSRARQPYDNVTWSPAYSTAWGQLAINNAIPQDGARQAANRRQFVSLMKAGLAVGNANVLNAMVDKGWIYTSLKSNQITDLYNQVLSSRGAYAVHTASVNAINGGIYTMPDGDQPWLIPYDVTAWTAINQQFIGGVTMTSGYCWEEWQLG